jgi:hypothetical protein
MEAGESEVASAKARTCRRELPMKKSEPAKPFHLASSRPTRCSVTHHRFITISLPQPD